MTDGIHFRSGHFPFPFHSVLIAQNGKLIQEEYFSPASKDGLHRMFSITKSFTALAVSALIAEGKLSAEDPIIRFFPEFTPEKPHPYLREMTVQNLLDMRTCYDVTTYKANLSENWVRSFFITAPTHRPGQIFKYDTSAAHTLAALVKRLTGLGVLDYLRTVYLDGIGFSKDAKILTDPFGDEIGGSGLIAKSSDLLALSLFLMALYKGTWREQYSHLLSPKHSEAFFDQYASLFRQCVSYRSPTMHEGKTLEECQGYGSQFWRIRNGFMMYGMGGQYALFYPEEDLIIVTTADTQSLQGGTQIILDEANRIDTLLRSEEGKEPSIASLPHCPKEHGDGELLDKVIANLAGQYRFSANRNGFVSCSISDSEVLLEHNTGIWRFPIRLNEAAETEDPVHHQKLFVFTSPLSDGSLYLYAQIYDDNLGSVRILIHGGNGKITVYLRKIEEFLYPEMNGFLEAEKQS